MCLASNDNLSDLAKKDLETTNNNKRLAIHKKRECDSEAWSFRSSQSTLEKAWTDFLLTFTQSLSAVGCSDLSIGGRPSWWSHENMRRRPDANEIMGLGSVFGQTRFFHRNSSWKIVAIGIQIYQGLDLHTSNIEWINLKSFQPSKTAGFGEGIPKKSGQSVEDYLLFAIDTMEKLGVGKPLPCAATHGTSNWWSVLRCKTWSHPNWSWIPTLLGSIHSRNGMGRDYLSFPGWKHTSQVAQGRPHRWHRLKWETLQAIPMRFIRQWMVMGPYLNYEYNKISLQTRVELFPRVKRSWVFNGIHGLWVEISFLNIFWPKKNWKQNILNFYSNTLRMTHWMF